MNALQQLKKRQNGLQSLLGSMSDELEGALPGAIGQNRFIQAIINECRKQPALYECNPLSLLGAIFAAANMGLTFGTKEAYLVPYGKEINFQVGYIGLCRLVRRAPNTKTFCAVRVYENDEFDLSRGSKPFLHHKPNLKPEGEPIFYYSIVHFIKSGFEFDYWSTEEIKSHRDRYSKAFKRKPASNPWTTAFDEMAKKTPSIRLCKTQDMSFEVAQAVAYDGLDGRDLISQIPEVKNNAEYDKMAAEFFEEAQVMDTQEQISANAQAGEDAKNAAIEQSKK